MKANHDRRQSLSWFTRFAKATARRAGQPVTFALATLTLLIWAASGPVFGFSDTWQLIINTGTTIITFLMVFLIQNTQNRDTEALQLKLDELIRAVRTARNEVLDVEEMDEEELLRFKAQYEKLAKQARNGRQRQLAV